MPLLRLLRVIDPKCLLCGGSAILSCESLPGYQEPQRFRIYYCSHCNCAFAFPMKSGRRIYDLIYKNIDQVQGYARYKHYYDNIVNKRFPLDYLAKMEESYWATSTYLRRLRSQGSESPHILEIGSGLGYLTYALHREGFWIKGIDNSEISVQMATNRFGSLFECVGLDALIQSTERQYDVILLNQLIEHLTDIKAFLRKAMRLLAPRGEIFVTTPNKSIYSSALSWQTELPPVHLWWLSEESLKSLGRSIGCRVEFLDFEEFYRNNYRRIITENLEDEKSTRCPRAVFNVEGRILLKKPIKKQRALFRQIIEGTPAVGYYRTLRDYLTKKERWQGNRGPICCGIFKRSEGDDLWINQIDGS
jgi:SAM-dependent methyltransferase